MRNQQISPERFSPQHARASVWRWRQQAGKLPDHNQLVMLCSSYRVATDITSWSCNGQSNGRLLAAQTPEYSTAVHSTGVEAGHRTGRQVLGEILNPTLNPIHNLTGSRWWLSSPCNAVTFFLPGNLSSSPAYFVL